MGIGSLTSITAFRSWTSAGGSDSDYSQADLVYVPQGADNSTEFRTFTQEIRLAGQWGRLDWLVGMFYSNEEIDRRFSFLTGSQYARFFAPLAVKVTRGFFHQRHAFIEGAVEHDGIGEAFILLHGGPHLQTGR